LGTAVRNVIRYKGLKIAVFENVYEPAEDTYLLAENIPREPTRLLEIGTGTGIVALTAARLGHDVTATDVNPAATACARWNARINRTPIDVREGDLFEPVRGETYDVVLFNPPYLPPSELPEDDPIHAATEDPTVIRRFLRGLIDREVEWKKAYLVVSTLTPDEHLRPLRHLHHRTVATRRLFFEELRLLEITRGKNP